MRRIILALIGGAACSLAGCSQTAYFTPVSNLEPIGQLNNDEASYVVPVGSGQQATVTVAARGITRPEPKALQSGAIAVRFVVHNPTGTPVRVTSVRLVGENDQVVQLQAEAPNVYASASGERAGSTAPGAQGITTANEFVGFLPTDMALDEVNTFQLDWTADVGGNEQHYWTQFQRNYSSLSHGGNWNFADTDESKATGVWYGIVGPPVGYDEY